MSVTVDIEGIPVMFPFTPYDIQKDYMTKVIQCIQNETTAVLESPTGTGKTLSLLCSSLAWLRQKKKQVLEQRRLLKDGQVDEAGALIDVDEKAQIMAGGREFLGLPRIVYASRTHSQLSQAVQELKRTAYNDMQTSVLGSRVQLCIHPEVIAEEDQSLKLHMCRLKVNTRSCHYLSRVERKKDDPEISNVPIIDIEDMVKLGTKHLFCPYYMTKDRQNKSDIIFAPYNYLLDPVARKALGLNLANCVVILDEGHNVEKVCEEYASIDIKSTDLAVAIDEVTNIMKMISESPGLFEESPKDINPEDVAVLKEMLLSFEKILDEVDLNTGDQITYFPGDFIYEMLEKAQITSSNFMATIELIDSMIQYLQAQNEGPFARKGKGLQIFHDFLTIVFQSKASKDKVRHCYKVHIKEEDTRRPGRRQIKTWLDKGSTAGKCRILGFWCFSPGFGMNLIMSYGIRALILTSGTLAPLKPLISELELDVRVSLENPHIIKENQVCVKILPIGPDGEALNSSYRNRDNPKYITSLGRAIVNLARIIPNGLLIFFPSYPIMQKCQSAWEAEGIWASIASQKAIFVEPRGKDAFSAAMIGYYEKIQDPNLKGAVFMAVCRGKVSEGLDFADANGRAVIITGLPYPPLMDPRVILKRRYLDSCHAQNKEYLRGQDWYSLEASRTVNQAIGRVIRHRNDYGAILLLDERFNNLAIKEQMSKWLRNYITVVKKYGEIIRDLSQFFRKAQNELPAPVMKPIIPQQAKFEVLKSEKLFNDSTVQSSTSYESTSAANYSGADTEMINKYLGTTDNPNGEVRIHTTKRENQEPLVNINKRKKFHLSNKQVMLETIRRSNVEPTLKASMSEYVIMVKNKLGATFKEFANHLKEYRETRDIEAFIKAVDPLVPQHLRYIFTGMDTYITGPQKIVYRNFLRQNNLAIPEDL